jgi:PiT family inorganic phosphate transporter
MTIILLLVLAALLLSYANGANDNFKAVATIYGSTTLGYRAALALATGAQVAGSIASVLLAGALLKAFGGTGLVPDATVADPRFLLAVGLGAAATVLLATRLGMPVSTTHVSTGAIFGIGLWTGSAHGSVVIRILAAWLATLPVALVLGYAVAAALGA